MFFIVDVSNPFLVLNVLCMCVCLEFIHKVVYVDLDIVIEKLIQKFNLSIFDVSKSFKIELPRDDYLQESNNEYDMWLHNAFWKYLLTIYLVNRYP